MTAGNLVPKTVVMGAPEELLLVDYGSSKIAAKVWSVHDTRGHPSQHDAFTTLPNMCECILKTKLKAMVQ